MWLIRRRRDSPARHGGSIWSQYHSPIPCTTRQALEQANWSAPAGALALLIFGLGGLARDRPRCGRVARWCCAARLAETRVARSWVSLAHWCRAILRRLRWMGGDRTTGGSCSAPEGSRKKVQHLEGGIVRRTLVQDGSKVAVGEPLIELDTITRRMPGTRATEVRLLAEQTEQANLAGECRGMPRRPMVRATDMSRPQLRPPPRGKACRQFPGQHGRPPCRRFPGRPRLSPRRLAGCRRHGYAGRSRVRYLCLGGALSTWRAANKPGADTPTRPDIQAARVTPATSRQVRRHGQLGGSMFGSGQEVATELEEVVDLALARKEPLGMPCRLEALHLPFSSSRRLVRDLRPLLR